MLRDQLERYNQRLQEFEERQRAYRGVGITAHSERGRGGSTSGASAGGAVASHGQTLEVIVIFLMLSFFKRLLRKLARIRVLKIISTLLPGYRKFKIRKTFAFLLIILH